eukprot:scaffold239302_cov20-Prasinocladus_malaysianus.AAC.1
MAVAAAFDSYKLSLALLYADGLCMDQQSAMHTPGRPSASWYDECRMPVQFRQRTLYGLILPIMALLSTVLVRVATCSHRTK